MAQMIKCKHDVTEAYCLICNSEAERRKSELYKIVESEAKNLRKPIYKGCYNKVCYCTGDCMKIIGYKD
jgi:hypothetical protein